MWFIIGIATGVVLLALVWWLRSRNIKVTWYDWLIGLIGLFLLLFTVQNIVGSFDEVSPTAAWMFLLFLGIPSLVLLVLAWQLVMRRKRTAS